MKNSILIFVDVCLCVAIIILALTLQKARETVDLQHKLDSTELAIVRRGDTVNSLNRNLLDRIDSLTDSGKIVFITKPYPLANTPTALVNVDGYNRRNGTHVHSYDRHLPAK